LMNPPVNSGFRTILAWVHQTSSSVWIMK
jgi:hypothetical protein